MMIDAALSWDTNKDAPVGIPITVPHRPARLRVRHSALPAAFAPED